MIIYRSLLLVPFFWIGYMACMYNNHPFFIQDNLISIKRSVNSLGHCYYGTFKNRDFEPEADLYTIKAHYNTALSSSPITVHLIYFDAYGKQLSVHNLGKVYYDKLKDCYDERHGQQ